MDTVVSLWHGGVRQEVHMALRKQRNGAFKTRVVVEASAGHKPVTVIVAAGAGNASSLK